MSNSEEYQLPAGIQMPDQYARRLSYQVWFYTGVQAGLENRPPQDVLQLRNSYGSGIAAAYQAGLKAGRQKRAEVETPAHQIRVPEEYSQSLEEKIWFLKGVDDFQAGQPLEQPPSLPQRRATQLLRAYRAGYLTGQQRAT